ncbi:MAG: SulP family inorganic anion transporter [Lachnospiraceae bacterium]|nr:SulP family inorganic anion transporter [Lachnospiraceae bacterium]
MRLIGQIKTKPKSIHLQKDLFAGLVVALVSIPISMGYAQIAGLPPVYGLYGSLLPILVFGLLTTSPQFVVGVDAMPAVMVGGVLAQLEIAPESAEALRLVPLMAYLVAAWFVILWLFRAGRVVKYISTPVMGGFISGVGATIILMQVPKLFGGSPGTGEIFDLVGHIVQQLAEWNGLSFVLGGGTVLLLLFCKKKIPKVPMTVIMMVAGAALQYAVHLERYGVKLMTQVESGLPGLCLPAADLLGEHFPELVVPALGIAGVIMAQTLLASGNYAMKYQDTLDTNAELLAYAAMNLAGGVTGSCPINGSVSRSGIADSLGCRSQVMSLAASVSMLAVLMFGTPMLRFLPVPVLTGIVITALIGILEMDMARKLWRKSKNEWLIFMTAFLGVLIFGTVYGVIIGVLLSFWEVAIRATVPPTALVGRIEGQEDFYSLERNRRARPIRQTVIYRFSGNLFFANIDLFERHIEQALREDTKRVIVDARGIGSVDVTATERLMLLRNRLQEKGIAFYITEHDGSLNDQLKKLGGERLIEEGVVRRTISLALRDAGVDKPYELEYAVGEVLSADASDATAAVTRGEMTPGETVRGASEADERLSEFEWAFGADAEKMMEQLAYRMADALAEADDGKEQVEQAALDEEGIRTSWGMLGRFDEGEFWDFMEIRLEELVARGKISAEFAAKVERHVEQRRSFGQQKLREINPHAEKLLAQHGEVIHKYLQKHHPQEYEKLVQIQRERHDTER